MLTFVAVCIKNKKMGAHIKLVGDAFNCWRMQEHGADEASCFFSFFLYWQLRSFFQHN
jgi:hypothetical protein